MSYLEYKILFQILAWFLLLGTKTISAQDPSFYAMVDKLTSENVSVIKVEELENKNTLILLDVRTKKEYELSHIKNAIWVGEKNWDMKTFKNLDKKKMIVVYCSVGFRSEKLVRKLLRINSQKTFNLYGGIFDWVNKGNPVENSHGITDSIHGFNKNFAQWIRKGVAVY